ncbi:hypothetical protein G7043_44990 [Lentzea sp. NEAU-D13]|uniref:DUF7824 domain-containing protein n=1 Tax=Lentzea alba TaxID=2714351 RepID=A0A7C9RZV5_9PSEU|nr:DUF6493 family protein [Lentzea alba]NGY66066.1 hypothetical protein [Lentzea alba]
MTFDEIRGLIEADEPVPLREALNALTPDQRKEFAKDLIAYEKKHRAGDRSWHHQATLAIAGAGLMPNASALTPWLMRYQIWHHRMRPDGGITDLIDVLRQRDLAWMPDLVARLGAKMPTRELNRFDLMRVILEFCGENPPDSDGFLRHFMTLGGHTRWQPGFDALIPRMLEVVGTGVVFATTRQWPPFLRDRADRKILLDGCLARLQQGGGAKEMEGFLALHEVLQVTLDETAEHARDYVAMLPDSRSTVAGLAQERLKSADEAGKLDLDLLTDASRWVFGRTEKKLVRTQLTWLAKHAKSTPDAVVLTVAELFAHPSDDLRGQAVKLVAKDLTKISDATRTELLTLAEQLPADMAEQLGSTTTPDETAALAPFVPTPFPEPIATIDELTGEVLSLFGRNARYVDPINAERVVEAIVRFAWQDREAVAQAFQPMYEKYPWLLNEYAYETYADHARRNAWTELIAIIAVVSKPVQTTEPDPEAAPAWQAQFERARAGAVGEQLTLRLHDIQQGLLRSPRPALVSTPTETSGLLDPATLLDRLAKAEADGWEPWPRDLTQACHRLPRDVDPETFASLQGAAGQRLRELLGFRSDPVVELVERVRGGNDSYYRQTLPERRLFVTVEPGLATPEQHWFGHGEWSSMYEWWPSILPAQREIVAAHLVPHLAHRMSSKGGDGPLLPSLAEADGPIGVAMNLALGYGLAAELTVNRAHAVDALLILAARDQFDGQALGSVLGRLLEGGYVPLNRIVPGLRDVARSGAAVQVWDVVVTALPKLWAHNRVADVVELAVELAQQLKPGGEIDGLAEVAARKGSSKAVVQAKRLVAALG